MTRRFIFLSIVLFIVITCFDARADIETHRWNFDAETLYDDGFMHMLRKNPGGGVCLFDNVVVENDSPGAGISEKGVCSDYIWGDVQGRKVLVLDDIHTKKAWFFVFSHRRGDHPLSFSVNGHESRIAAWKRKGYERFRWVEFPIEWLKKGKNVIDMSCPEAASPEEGWEIWLARADEFEAGGGDPSHVGETSFKSFNGGRSWKESPFGNAEGEGPTIDGFAMGDGTPEQDVRAEYSVRICLERYVNAGWLESPVIDLWLERTEDFFSRMRTIQELRLSAESSVPEGATVTWFLRRGTKPGPFAEGWESWEKLGEGPALDRTISGGRINRRYIQLRAELATANPLVTPVIENFRIEADFEETFPVPRHENIYVVSLDNEPVKYSSIDWKWEPSDRKEFEQIRQRENLDAVISGSRTTFEAQVRLLDHVTKRFRWTPPLPEYPAWDAVSTLDRITKAGGGGMCIQFNNILAGMCMAYGWQARLVNIDGHEICEVWNDEYAKWIYIDASNVNHWQCDIETGVPMNMLDLHNVYMDYFYQDRVMDWLEDYRYPASVVNERDDKPPIVRSSLTYHDIDTVRYTGFIQSRFFRMVPRSNWLEQPYPRPLSHGNGSHWPWNGYINWYDERTPPRIQYSWHTDRPRDMYPDLNTVHISAAQGYGNDRLFLQFETYTPNFCHYEVNCDEGGWQSAGDEYAWLLVPGKNALKVRAVSKLGVQGKPSSVTVNRVVVPMKEFDLRIYPE